MWVVHLGSNICRAKGTWELHKQAAQTLQLSIVVTLHLSSSSPPGVCSCMTSWKRKEKVKVGSWWIGLVCRGKLKMDCSTLQPKDSLNRHMYFEYLEGLSQRKRYSINICWNSQLNNIHWAHTLTQEYNEYLVAYYLRLSLMLHLTQQGAKVETWSCNA